MVEFGTSSSFRGWVRVRVLGYGSGVRGRKVNSRDCALVSDLIRAHTCERGVLSEFLAARTRTCASYWCDKPFSCHIQYFALRLASASASGVCVWQSILSLTLETFARAACTYY